MKLSEVKNEAALEMLADLLEPVAEILADKEISQAISAGKKMQAIKSAIKKHKKAVFTMMAILDGVPVESYTCNIITLPMKLIEILNDEELAAFFTSQVQSLAADDSGSVTGSIKDHEIK